MWRRLVGEESDQDDYDYNEAGRHPSSTDAYRRTRESYDERKQRYGYDDDDDDDDRENVDYDWAPQSSPAETKGYWRRKLEDIGAGSDEFGPRGAQRRTPQKRYLDASDHGNSRDSNNWIENSRRSGGRGGGEDSTFGDMGWEELDRRTTSDNDRDWRNFVRHGRTDELYRPKEYKEHGKKKWKDEKKKKEKKEKKRMTKGGGTSHVVCVDDTDDAMRAFRHAAKRLPRGDRLILTHGMYEGLLGRSRDDEEHMRRVQRKYLSACTDMDRECEFKPLSYTSMGNFGEEVCDLAERMGARGVIIGKRAEVSDMRRRLVGSASESVRSNCRLPVRIISHDMQR